MMIESMAGKSASLNGVAYDATPFTFSEDDPAVDHFGNLLKQCNFPFVCSLVMFIVFLFCFVLFCFHCSVKRAYLLSNALNLSLERLCFLIRLCRRHLCTFPEFFNTQKYETGNGLFIQWWFT